MVKWKLVRQIYGTDEYSICEDEEITIGRGVINNIILSSLVISRQHCIIKTNNGKITIKDLNSSNGTFVDGVKIQPNTFVPVSDQQIIGVGWADGNSMGNVQDSEKFLLKLIKEKSITDRITFLNDIEENEEELFESDSKVNLKRPFSSVDEECDDNNVIDLCLSDSDTEAPHSIVKRIKTETTDNTVKACGETKINNHVGVEYEVFNVKQEYQGYDEDPINVDSDSSDSDTERRWLMRLSQGSPGGPLIKQEPFYVEPPADTSVTSPPNIPDDEEFYDDIITFPTKAFAANEDLVSDEIDTGKALDCMTNIVEESTPLETRKPAQKGQDKCISRTILIDNTWKPAKTKRKSYSEDKKSSGKSSSKHRSRSHSHSKIHITNSQKEERKKRLKDIAIKDKETKESTSSNEPNSSKSKVNIKLTTSNRGAFLTESITPVKPAKINDNKSHNETKICNEDDNTKTKHNKSKNKTKDKSKDSKSKVTAQVADKIKENVDKEKNANTNFNLDLVKISEHKDEPKAVESKISKEDHQIVLAPLPQRVREKSRYAKNTIALKDLKPLTEKESSWSGKPVSKIEPMNTIKKRVRFSTDPPQVKIFEIEPGNKMKKTSLVKATLLDALHAIQRPLFSLEKIILMKILKWNPHWLTEQLSYSEPPPILGHDKPPMTVIHSFKNHSQYAQVIGDLLLMEIWECITQAYMRKNNQENPNNKSFLNMSIESLSPFPTAERSLDIFSLSVNISVPKCETRTAPSTGDLILATFGPENSKTLRFFFVHNVKCLPSPPNNKYAFYSIILHCVYTDKMKTLRRGEQMIGQSLAFIKNELALFEAMEYMTRSPLSEAILRPEPKHYHRETNTDAPYLKSRWTERFNKSQLEAVATSVTAALSDKPSIQLIQGPPGTGKSGVVCAIVMTYLQCIASIKPANRGKILICATSNAAVDEIVGRLLEIRQSLPKSDRFRMVRVGRKESMSPRARDLSSQSLAERDVQRAAEPTSDTQQQEIQRLEARINMWRSQAQESKDDGRIAFCQGQITDLMSKISRLRSTHGGSSGEISMEQLVRAEKRIIECADIVVTTLASVANHKMKGLKRRIALCIVDEAGQSIEPETLLPLTLDVTKLTLVGDPQQLPGYICSQRAKQYGLGESLFSRVSGSMESWSCGGSGSGAVVLLDVQYRMHREIAQYPARTFYGGRLRTDTRPHPALRLRPYLMVNISSGDQGQGAHGGNEMEAWGVSRVTAAVAASTAPLGLSVAVITPYNGHKELIKRNLRGLQQPGSVGVEVTTVDSFQGQERDVVVVSLARSHGVGFLTDAGRMNVMLTRARHALFICLNMNAMTKNHQWRTLMDDAQKRNLVITLPNKLCQPTTAEQLNNEELLKLLS